MCAPRNIKGMKSEKIMWVEHVTRIRGSRNMHKIWVVKPDGKISLRIQSVERTMGIVLWVLEIPM
jgi:hypothetical protein